MRTKSTELSAHSKKVLELLNKSAKPLSAYEILDKLRKFGIKAPPTVYRALDALTERGMVHRIESLNAFVACHDEDEEDHDHNHTAQFAVCRGCGSVTEIHDHRLSDLIHELGKKIKFRIKREMLELLGMCQQCEKKAGA
jgi:Fur family zinc uptake transcriptional regulator